jgi:hypothetical protein
MIYDLFVLSITDQINGNSRRQLRLHFQMVVIDRIMSVKYIIMSRLHIFIYWQNKDLMCFTYYDTFSISKRGRRGRDRMVVGFTTIYAISAYHHWCCEFESRPGRGVQHYVIKFVSDLRQVGGFLKVLRFPPPIKPPYNWNIVESKC